MPGPPPKHPDQKRRRNKEELRHLPAEGRKGPPPPWPLSKANKAEADVWKQVWTTPHSVAWERLGWTRTVARYVRQLILSEKREAKPSLLGEVRQLEDRLGLTTMAMLRLRWEIVEDEVGEQRAERESDAEILAFKVVDPDAVAGP